MFEENFIIADIETTGLSAKVNEIIEIGAIKVKEGKILDTMDILIKPKNSVPPFITNLTGITNEMLKEGLNLENGMKKFVDFIEDYPLVFHNAKFDMSFLNRAMFDVYDKNIENNVIDTLLLSRKLVPDIPNYKLGTLANYFNISYKDAHRSLKDCQITLDVYNNLSKLC